MPMNKTKLKIIAGVLVVFLLGVCIGVLGTGIFIRRQIRRFTQGDPGMHTEFFMRRLIRELDLTEVQIADIETIIHATGAELRTLLQDSHGEFMHIMQRRNVRIKHFLHPEQQQKLDELEQRTRGRSSPFLHRPERTPLSGERSQDERP